MYSIGHIRRIGLISLFAVFALAFGGAKIVSASTLIAPGNHLGLVGYWAVNEGQGTQLLDKSGYGNHGFASGTPSWADGKFGRSLSFDGASYISFSTTTPFTLATATSAKTFSAWIKTTATLGASILSLRDTGDGNPVFDLQLGGDGVDNDTLPDAGKVSFLVRASDGSGLGHIHSANSVNDGLWHHVAAVRDTAKNLFIFIDGAQVASGADTMGSGLTPSVSGLRIGDEAMNNNIPNMIGSIDDIRIYSRALSAFEVANLYSQSTASRASINKKGLVAYYPMDEGSGSTIYDKSGQNNGNGVMTTGTSSAQWVGGKYGSAIDFDGVDDFINLGNPTALQTLSAPGQDSSWSFWFKRRGGGRIFGKYYPFQIEMGATVGRFIYNGTSWVQNDNGTTPVTIGIWHNVVWTIDRDGYSTQYLDGVIDGNATDISASSNESWPTSNTFVIGARNDDGSFPFDGAIDEFRVYNRVLSASEVSKLYSDSSAARITKISTSMKGGLLANGLVGHWTFDGPDLTTTTSTDVSGSGNNGTLTNGPSPVRGKVGQALKFDGVNDQVQTLNQFTNTSFSYSGWFKTTAASAGLLIGAYNTQNGSDLSFGSYHFYLSNDGKLRQHQYPGTDITFASTNTYNDGNWHQFVVTFDNTGQITKLYLDGSLDITNNNGFNNYANYWVIGAGTLTGLTSANNGVNYFQGALDDIRVYNKNLSAAEVFQLYNNTK